MAFAYVAQGHSKLSGTRGFAKQALAFGTGNLLDATTQDAAGIRFLLIAQAHDQAHRPGKHHAVQKQESVCSVTVTWSMQLPPRVYLAILGFYAVHLVRWLWSPLLSHRTPGLHGCCTHTCGYQRGLLLAEFWQDPVHLTIAPLTGCLCLPTAWAGHDEHA